MSLFRHDQCLIDFVETSGAFVAAGAPTGPTAQSQAAGVAFADAAARQGLRACFFGVNETDRQRLGGCTFLPIGWQGWWQPERWPHVVAESASLRAQLRRACAKGVHIIEIPVHDLVGAHSVWRKPVQDLIDRWRSRKDMAPLGFVTQLPADQGTAFADNNDRVLAAMQGQALVAIARVVCLPAPHAWVLHDLLRLPQAPNGTSELLIDATMHLANQEAEKGRAVVHEVSLGLIPLFGNVPRALAVISRLTQGLFSWRGLHNFKQKLKPHRRESIFVAYTRSSAPTKLSSTLTILDVLRAFAGQPLWQFALRTFIRGPKFLLHLLAWLLLPWTVLLAWAAPNYWFPQPWVRWAWSAFDVLLAAGFFLWRDRHARGLLRALAVAVGVDACLTTAQVFVADLPRIHDAGHMCGCAVAVAGPWLTFALLISAHRRLRDAPAPQVSAVTP